MAVGLWDSSFKNAFHTLSYRFAAIILVILYSRGKGKELKDAEQGCIADTLTGKDRRGVPVYEKDDDGAEILFEHYKKWLTYADNGREIVRQRRERIKHLADDLPKVAKAYKEFKEGKV